MANVTFLSYSGMRLYKNCPGAYYQRYVLRSKVPTSPFMSRNTAVGSCSHTCMSRWVKESKCEPGWMDSIADEVWNEYISKVTCAWRGADDCENLRARLKEYLPQIEQGFFQLDLHLHEVRSEESIKVWLPRSKLFLGGKVDLIDDTSNVILDLKATKSAEYFDFRQGCFYCLAKNLETKSRRYTRFIQFVPLRRVIDPSEEFSDDDFIAFRNELTDVIAGIRADAFEYTGEGNTCFSCDYRNICPKEKGGAIFQNGEDLSTGKRKLIIGDQNDE